MERSQLGKQSTSSTFQEASSKNVRGRAEFNVPDVKNEPISNTYNNPGWNLHRRIVRMYDELIHSRPVNREVPGKPQINHFTPTEKLLQKNMYRKKRL